MIIPVRISGAPRATKSLSAGGKEGLVVPNWSMVELQGELISKEPLSGQSLGTMTLEGVSETLVLIFFQILKQKKQPVAPGSSEVTM